MARMVMGAYGTAAEADEAIKELEKIGIPAEDISFITKETKTIKHEESHEAGDTAADTVAGASSGAVTGGVIGGLAGLLAGAGVVPALAGLFIGGPVAAALGLTGVAAAVASGATTGAAAGGLLGALTGLGVSEETAESYESMVESGGVVLGVPAEGEKALDAKAVLDDTGAEDIVEVEA